MAKLIDLTGATVVFNDSLDAAAVFYYQKELTFICDGTTYSSIKLYEDVVMYIWLYYGDTVVTSKAVVGGILGPWADDKYKTIQITGGTDATNTDVIQWILDNSATIEGGVWEEEKPPLIIKNPLTLFLSAMRIDGNNLIVTAEDVEIIEEEIEEPKYFYVTNGSVTYDFLLPEEGITFKELFLNYGSVVSYSSNNYYIYNSYNSSGCLNVVKYTIDNNIDGVVYIGNYSDNEKYLPGNSFAVYLSNVIISGHTYTFSSGGGGGND